MSHEKLIRCKTRKEKKDYDVCIMMKLTSINAYNRAHMVCAQISHSLFILISQICICTTVRRLPHPILLHERKYNIM